MQTKDSTSSPNEYPDTLSINKSKELQAILYEMNRTTWAIGDLAKLSQNHLHDDGRLENNEITPGGVEMLLDLCSEAAEKQQHLLWRISELLEVKACVIPTTIKLFEPPIENTPVYSAINEEEY